MTDDRDTLVDDIDRRIAERIETAKRKAAERKAERAELARRRNYGLKIRHRRKEGK